MTVGGVSASQSTVNAAPTAITASNGSSSSTITVIAKDAFGNAIQGATVVLSASGSNNTVTQPAGTTNASGVATGTLASTMAESKTISATIAGVAMTQTATVLVNPAAASALVFTGQPSTTQAGAPITPAVVVTARDQFDNIATGFTADIIVAIGANPAGGSLAGTTTRPAVAGVASFLDLSIDKAATGYTLTATSGGLNQASGAFDISAGGPDHLTITVQPSNTTAGAAITPSIRVEIRDQFDNLVNGASNSIALAIAADPSGGTLSGTTTRNALAGVATFSGLSIDKAGSGYTLEATSGGLTLDTSAPFDITAGAADHVELSVQPSHTVAAAAITPAVQVEIQDQFDNLVTDAATTITVGIASNPSGGSLSGTTARAAVAGVATFSGLSIDKAGTGYTLDAIATGLDGDISSAFDITVGAAARLGFFVQPTATAAGTPVSPPVQVEILDLGGNRVTGATNSVTLAMGANPGGGSLSGGGAVAAAGGVATFSNLSIDKAGIGYDLVATSGTLSAATSAAFDIFLVPDHLAFVVQPSNATAGAAIAPPIQVEIQDAANNRVTTATNSITLAIANNPNGGTLSGTPTSDAVAGVATFSGLSINKVGVGYTLQATSGTLTSAISTGFSINPGSATQLSFTGFPPAVPAGAPILPAVQVTAQDGQGNTATGYTGGITLAIENNPSSGTLTGATTVAAVAGVAVFTDVRIDSTGIGYTLRAASGLLADTVSGPFNVTDPVLVGAGDIADCTKLSDDATANLLDGIPGIVFIAGDNAYPNGRAQDFANCYDPTWGRHKARTLPVTGNHEYDSSATAADYRAYFGAAVADPLNNGGYYFGYDLGAWHIVVLNTDIPIGPQVTWLQADLAGRTNQCILALWHRPIFTSGSSGGRPSARPLWQALQNAGAEVVINGHDHLYQRFALQDSLGNADPTGIREFIAGTGGGETHSNFPNIVPNVEVDDRNNFSRGVLKLTLYPGSYSWEFIPAPGFGTFIDSGTAACH
ncbi:MAG: invasin domain 3-containing protein [Gemmatimonadales bacterium]